MRESLRGRLPVHPTPPRDDRGGAPTVIPETKGAGCEAGIDPVLEQSNTGPDFPWWAFI